MGVAPTSIEDSLNRAGKAVEAGEGLSGTGFWQAVAEVKRHPELTDRYAPEIASIDARAHRDWALLVLPLWLGTTLAVLATLVGLALVWWCYFLDGFAAGAALLIGTGVLLGATHGLAHLVVGRMVGIRFTCWFVGRIRQPQPGVKVDYATYLATPARSRAWMHASGALVTKAIPILLIGAAVAADVPLWALVVLVVLAVGQIITDALWSTRASDWKKFKREMAFAQRP